MGEAQAGMDEGPSGGRFALIVWPAALVVVFLLAGNYAVLRARAAKEEAMGRHSATVAPDGQEAGRTRAKRLLPPGVTEANPCKVIVGLYVDRIVEVSLKDNRWVVDFYVWFRWRDGHVDPGKTFQIIEGELNGDPILVNKATVDGEHYAVYRVKATMTKFFTLSRFPVDDHLLTIRIEDRKHEWYELEYVPDLQGTSLSSRARAQAFDVYDTDLVVKLHSYKTTRGDPRLPAEFQETHSQVLYGLWIRRPDWGMFFKMFQGLFAAVAVALLAFWVEPDSSARFRLGVGAFFASIAASYITARQLPPSGSLTLTDVVTGLGIVTVFLTLVHSTVAVQLWERKHNRPWSRVLDRIVFAVFAIGYVWINYAMASAAHF